MVAVQGEGAWDVMIKISEKRKREIVDIGDLFTQLSYCKFLYRLRIMRLIKHFMFMKAFSGKKYFLMTSHNEFNKVSFLNSLHRENFPSSMSYKAVFFNLSDGNRSGCQFRFAEPGYSQ